MALGIFTFCIVAILGLLTNGFTSERRTGSEMEASTLLRDYSIALERSQLQTNGSYKALAPWSSFSWKTTSSTNITITNGNYVIWTQVAPATTSSANRLMDVRLEIAWPTNARFDAKGFASNAAGSLSGRTFFFAR